MSIKGFLISGFVFTILATVLRVYDYLYYFDGSFLSSNSLFSWIAAALCFLVVIVIKINVMRTKKPTYVYGGISSITHAVCSFFAAFASGFTAYSMYTKIDIYESDTLSVAGFSVVLPFIILTALLALYFLFSAVVQLMNRMSVFSKVKVLEVIPMLWAIILVVYIFVHHSYALMSSETFFAVIPACFLLLAIVFKSKIVTEIDEQYKAYHRFMMFLGAAFSYWTTLFISETILASVVPTYTAVLPLEIKFISLSVTIYLLSFIFDAVFDPIKAEGSGSQGGSRYRGRDKKPMHYK